MSWSALEDWVADELGRAALVGPSPSEGTAKRVMATGSRHRRAASISAAAAVTVVIAGAASVPLLLAHHAAPGPAGAPSPLANASQVSPSSTPGPPDEPCEPLHGGTEPSYIGLTLAEARQRALAAGLIYVRIEGMDGRCYLLPANGSTRRLTVYLENGRVSWAHRG